MRPIIRSDMLTGMALCASAVPYRIKDGERGRANHLLVGFNLGF